MKQSMDNENITLFHNPRCSKSRQTLALLIDHGFEPNIVDYLKNPPSLEDLQEVLAKLGTSARDVLRTKEADYQTLGFDDPSLDDAEVLERLQKNPQLLERPIVITATAAAIGRPPENVLAILPSA